VATETHKVTLATEATEETPMVVTSRIGAAKPKAMTTTTLAAVAAAVAAVAAVQARTLATMTTDNLPKLS
jgi:hypothetical protein